MQSVLSDDYADLGRSRSRQWTIGDTSLAWCGGLVLPALIGAAIFSTGWLLLLAAAAVVGVSATITLTALLLTPVLTLVLYLVLARERSSVSMVDSVRLRRLDGRDHAEVAAAPLSSPEQRYLLILFTPNEAPR